MKSKFERLGLTFAFFMIGFLMLAVVHELVHGFIARQYCNVVLYDWVPTGEYFMRTRYINCTDMSELKMLRNMVEIVGYQLMAFYTGIVLFVVGYMERVA